MTRKISNSSTDSRKNKGRTIAIAMATGLLALSLSACNTVRGVGQDLTSIANTVDDAI